MRGAITYFTTHLLEITVFLAAFVAIVGLTCTSYVFVDWSAPALGIWPAVSVAGILTTLATLWWAKKASFEESDE